MAKKNGFIKEFKEFISRGSVIDLAVGVIIGGAFSAIVTSLTDNIIKPLINCIGGAEVQGKIHLVGDNYIDYGSRQGRFCHGGGRKSRRCSHLELRHLYRHRA